MIAKVSSTQAHLLGPLGSSGNLPLRTWSQLSDRSNHCFPEESHDAVQGLRCYGSQDLPFPKIPQSRG